MQTCLPAPVSLVRSFLLPVAHCLHTQPPLPLARAWAAPYGDMRKMVLGA